MAKHPLSRREFHRQYGHLDGRQRRPKAVRIYQNRPVPRGELFSGGHDDLQQHGESTPDSAPKGDVRRRHDIHGSADHPGVSRYGRLYHHRGHG